MAISIISSIGILTYGVLHQGIDIKAASRSLTILDQRNHNATTVEQRTTFVGLSPGDHGLKAPAPHHFAADACEYWSGCCAIFLIGALAAPAFSRMFVSLRIFRIVTKLQQVEHVNRPVAREIFERLEICRRWIDVSGHSVTPACNR